MEFGGIGDFGTFDLDFDMSDFDFSEEPDEIETAVYTRPVVHAPKACCYENAEEFAEGLTIGADHETFAFVSGGFVFGDFVEALVDLRKLSVRRMGIQTLSLNDENIDSIRNIVEWEPVERLDIVLSDYWYAHERKAGGLVDYLFEELDLEGLDLHVAFAGVHCKVWTIETDMGNCLTIHGSANLRSSGNIEQVHISPDRGLYEFCSSMTERILETYDVVNQDARKRKSVRGRKLWQAVAAAEAAEPGEAGAEKAGAHEEGAAHPTGREAASSGRGARADGTACTARCRSKGVEDGEGQVPQMA